MLIKTIRINHRVAVVSTRGVNSLQHHNFLFVLPSEQGKRPTQGLCFGNF